MHGSSSVLQFVSQSDNIQSCRFAQTMEQRLQKAFQDAERKVLSTRSNLTVQVGSRGIRLQMQTAIVRTLDRNDMGPPHLNCHMQM